MPTSLPVSQIQSILQAQGTVMNGVLSIEFDRTDLPDVTQHGIPFKPAFEINGTVALQPLRGGQALLNADVALLPSETNPFIDALLAHHLVFQAFHQHFFDLTPMVFFIHFRGIGDPLTLARGTAAAIKTTATPLPQTMPAHPTTPLDTQAIGQILGAMPMVGEDGVVTVTIPRADTIHLGGVVAKPETGPVAPTVAFEPLPDGRTVVVPDFAMIASEVQHVMRVMRGQGFVVNCLYNQETDESPQLFYSHQVAVGDAVDLARKVRRGLNQTNLKFTT